MWSHYDIKIAFPPLKFKNNPRMRIVTGTRFKENTSTMIRERTEEEMETEKSIGILTNTQDYIEFNPTQPVQHLMFGKIKQIKGEIKFFTRDQFKRCLIFMTY